MSSGDLTRRSDDAAQADRDLADRIEIRLLGPLQVRRADGSLIHPREFRTGKTLDLLRLLATRNGQPVSVDEILEDLWPDVDAHRGRGSLRNALGQLRRLLGQAAVERRSDGLVLRDAWVDTVAMVALADEARRHARQGRLALAVNVAREAEALHLGEFRTHDPDALWAVPVREHLETRFREMTIDAAEQAVDLGWMRDGLELGQRALDADPTSERAYRVLMRAYTGLGEPERALRVYERCRAVLAEDLGLDPSSHTRNLHLEILSAEHHDAPEPPFTGRERELRELVAWLRQRQSSQDPGVVYLSGAEGSGRTRLVHEAAHRAHARIEVVGPSDDLVAALTAACATDSSPSQGLRAEGADRSDGVLVLVSAAGRLTSAQRGDLLRVLASQQGAVTVVLRLEENARAVSARDQEASGMRGQPAAASPPTYPLHLLPLAPADLEQLATTLLSGPASARLLEELAVRSEGLPARVVATVDAWCRSGEITVTPQGLALVPPHDPSHNSAEQQALLVRAMERTSALEQQVFHLVALLDRPVSATLLAPLLSSSAGHEWEERGPDDVATVNSALNRLVDVRLLSATPEGHIVRDPFLRHAVESWLRPSRRRRLHVLIAEQARIPAAERSRHWRAAGEVELSAAAAIDAVRDAMAANDVSTARVHLLVVTDLAERTTAAAAHLAELEESLADVCVTAGRADEGVHHYRRAAEWIGRTDVHEAARLQEKAAQVERALPRPPVTSGTDRSTTGASDEPDEPDEPDDEARERAAWAAVLAADSSGDSAAGVSTRLRLVIDHLIPARRLTRAREVTQKAISLAADGPDLAAAVALHHLPDILLGNARVAERPLDAVWADVDRHNPHSGALAVLRCLVGHDLGRRDFEARWDDAMALAPPGSSAVDWTWARVRMLTERGSLAEAIEEDHRPPGPESTTLARQLRAVSTAGLLAALGRTEDALHELEQAMSEAEEEGCSLLLPEVTARRVVLTAPTDPEAAITLFEVFDWAAGSEIGHPREAYLRLLARAAIRAGRHELDRAAAAAANAARVAKDCGLVLLASEGYLAQAQHLFEGGRSAGARGATASAAWCLRAAGTVR
ncbi:BTAD domain-containing putative transcriptional regulator [Knoellia sp. CPCC 206435]|uniref:BTAD domain-containing putative transcriptional regulator n=1 Tax=Knoellia terrae TaxID=3404797 RepID=UPI003B4372EF